MPRVQPKKISHKERQEILNEFWSLLVLLETREEIENFFRDFLSDTEALMLARRIRIARLLLEGNSYEEIRERMAASYVTIAAVHRWLQGRNEGYAKLLPRLVKELKMQEKAAGQKAKKQAAQMSFGSFEWLKRRYPLHFLIFNLIDLSENPNRRRKKTKH